MRWLLLVLIALPAAAAHGERLDGGYLPHIRLAEVELAPGEDENWTLAYEGAPMQAGWHWLIRADVEGQVRVDVAFEGGQSASWQWGSGPQSETLVLNEAGHADLAVTNIGQGNATFAYYYDHTCDCSAKAAPLSPGLLWLNADAAAGEQVTLELFVQPVQGLIDTTPMPGDITVRLRHVTPDEVGGYVPHETAQKTFDTKDASCDTRHGRWNGCMDMSFEAQRAGRQLILVDVHDDAPSWHVLVMPNIEVTGKQTPGPPVFLLVGMLLAAAWCRRR